MSTLSIHPVEYLRLHVHYEGVLTGGLRAIGSLVKKVFALSEQAAAITLFLLAVGLISFSFMKIVQSASIAARYDAAITEVDLPPLQAVPTGMYPVNPVSL